jgi:hypothetical protein
MRFPHLTIVLNHGFLISETSLLMLHTDDNGYLACRYRGVLIHITAMRSSPWLTVRSADKNDLSFHLHQGLSKNVSSGNTPPDVTTFIGTYHKSRFLACLLGYAKPLPQHGQVHASVATSHTSTATAAQPHVVLDCEVSSDSSPGFQPDQWTLEGQPASEEFADHVIHHILTPLSGVLCYFAADMQGLEGVVRALALQVVLPKAHTLPVKALPSILIVVETRSKAYDSNKAQQDVRDRVSRAVAELKGCTTIEDATRDLGLSFQTIDVIGIQSMSSQRARTLQLSDRLSTLHNEVRWARRHSRYQFSAQHIDALSERIVSAFCENQRCFDFILESRPEQFDMRQIGNHIEELLALLRSGNWLWRVVAPLLASSFCLANYPPGSHCKFTCCSRQHAADIQCVYRLSARRDLRQVLFLPMQASHHITYTVPRNPGTISFDHKTYHGGACSSAGL